MFKTLINLILSNSLKIVNFKFQIILALFVFLTTHNLLLTTAYAESFSLSIYPPLLEITMQPGKTITQTYLIANGGDDILLTPKILPFIPADEHGHINFDKGERDTERDLPAGKAGSERFFSLKNSNITFGSPFLLKSGQTKELTLEINIPSDAEEKDYYLTLLFSGENQTPVIKSTSRQTGSIGANLLLTVSESGKPILRGQVVQFSILNSQFSILDSFTAPKFLLRVQNTGKSAFKPFGKITIEGLFGDKWNYDLWPDNILINSIREIRPASPSASAFLLGPYTASANFYLNEEKEGAEVASKITFIALPIKAVFILIVTLLAIVIVTKLSKRKK